MALPQHYLMALLTPFGRINQVGFAMLAIALAFAHLWAYFQLKMNPDLDVWNQYTIMLFAMLWMKFCILSRRMHDTCSSGFFLVPVLFLTAILYLCAIDPSSMGAEGIESPTFKYFLDQGMRIPRALLIASFIYCIRAQGEAGPNGYGPEFGDTLDKGPSDKNAPMSNQPQHAFRTAGRQPARGSWGERKRPAGFGRR